MLCEISMKPKYIYLSIFSVVVFILAFILPTTEMMKGIYATPGLLGLFAILYQILRDQSVLERDEALLRKQQVFSIGAASHMADVAFDKHVEFCDKYLKQVHEAVFTLYRDGPTAAAVNFGNALYLLRLEYSAWLTEEINNDLFPFEQALRELGAKQGFIKQTAGVEQYAQTRLDHINQVYEDFKRILSFEAGKEPDPNIAVESVKKRIREILGIEDLVTLRKALVEQAINAINT